MTLIKFHTAVKSLDVVDSHGIIIQIYQIIKYGNKRLVLIYISARILELFKF